MSVSWIRLLSGRPFSDFTPESFKEHVRSLYFKAEKPKKEPKLISWRFTKTGALSLTVRRKPKTIFTAEITKVATESALSEEQVRQYLTKKKITEVLDVQAQ